MPFFHSYSHGLCRHWPKTKQKQSKTKQTDPLYSPFSIFPASSFPHPSRSPSPPLSQRIYGSHLVAFYDLSGGLSIACLWNPSILSYRTFKPYLGLNVEPVSVAVGPSSDNSNNNSGSSNMVKLNKKSVMDEIKRLGAGLVTRIEVLKIE